MFVGHFALGFAAKRAAPRVSLAALFAAAQLPDLVWPVLVAAGIERVRIDPGNTAFTPLDFVSYPYSHSLLMLVLWSIGVAIAYRLVSGHDGRAVAVLSGLVLSHWVLDWVSHRADMPLIPGGRTYGLGLWNSIPATLAVELAIFAAGVSIYARTTRARDRVGRWSLVALVLVLLTVYALNVSGGPPPSVQMVWLAGVVGGALLIAWSGWTDRHREPARATRQ
jgi:hypothetical protein